MSSIPSVRPFIWFSIEFSLPSSKEMLSKPVNSHEASSVVAYMVDFQLMKPRSLTAADIVRPSITSYAAPRSMATPYPPMQLPMEDIMDEKSFAPSKGLLNLIPPKSTWSGYLLPSAPDSAYDGMFTKLPVEPLREPFAVTDHADSFILMFILSILRSAFRTPSRNFTLPPTDSLLLILWVCPKESSR